MSDFRFGIDDYGLNYHPHDDVSDGFGGIDWDKVEYVEIDWVKFVQERTCHITALGLPLSDYPIGKCSNCGCGADVSSNYCWQCGAKVER